MFAQTTCAQPPAGYMNSLWGKSMEFGKQVLDRFVLWLSLPHCCHRCLVCPLSSFVLFAFRVDCGPVAKSPRHTPVFRVAGASASGGHSGTVDHNLGSFSFRHAWLAEEPLFVSGYTGFNLAVCCYSPRHHAPYSIALSGRKGLSFWFMWRGR